MRFRAYLLVVSLAVTAYAMADTPTPAPLRLSAPGAPADVTLTVEGMVAPGAWLPYVNTTANAAVGHYITWTQAPAGEIPIAKNRVYRSTTGPDEGFVAVYTSTSPAVTYTDLTAVNFDGMADTTLFGIRYWYKVSAIDGQGREGPLSSAQGLTLVSLGDYPTGVDLAPMLLDQNSWPALEFEVMASAPTALTIGGVSVTADPTWTAYHLILPLADFFLLNPAKVDGVTLSVRNVRFSD